MNKIRSLKNFSALSKLRELYLRKNHIDNLEELRFLAPLKNLKVLWLADNPIAELEEYKGIEVDR